MSAWPGAPEPEPLAFVGTSDLAGLLRGKSFPLAELDARRERGVGVTPSNLMLSAFGPIQDTPFGTRGELMLVPEPSTRTAIPSAEGPDVALFLGGFRTEDGAPWACCPREFLARGLVALAREGFTLLATFEQEMVYTGVEDRPGAPYTLDALRRQGAFGPLLLGAMRAAGIAPDSFLAEYGPRQYEVTAGPVPGMAAADQAVLVRELARAVAARLGHRAVLAPILHPDGVGNGTHVHWSLLDTTGRPATWDPSGTHGLSEAAEHVAAGMLHHLPALVALTAPSAASYVRLRPGRWAPTVSDLAVQDRGSAVRVIGSEGPPEAVARRFNVEFRVADACASPYLALGALVHAGVDGLRRRLRLSEVPPAPLPASLGEALDRLEGSEAATAWLGPELRMAYLRFKRAELKGLAGLTEAEVCARYAAVY